MPLEVKQFSCPKCGSPLSLKNAARSRSLVCPSCHSQIDLTGAQYQVVTNVGPSRPPAGLPLQLGLRGALAGHDLEIIGRLTYRDDEDYKWDEWLLLSAAGDYFWLSDDEEEGIVLWHSFTPANPVDPNTVREGGNINLEGTPSRVSEVGDAIIDYLEGELTWKAGKGEKIRALDAEGSGKLYSIEWTPDEIEFYRGQRLSRDEVRRAFGLTSATSPSSGGTGARKAVSLGVVITAVIVLAVAAFCCVGVLGASGLDFGGSDCLSTPAAVRSADCQSGGSDEGGFFGSSGGGVGGGK